MSERRSTPATHRIPHSGHSTAPVPSRTGRQALTQPPFLTPLPGPARRRTELRPAPGSRPQPLPAALPPGAPIRTASPVARRGRPAGATIAITIYRWSVRAPE
ncbi:hypothetical protein GCM10010383_55180 [Streptomyces lomondensis]|uniref:Uncharacterized protein n=1 Tax=Streptomyces lomondensis TaxID=68229 RepID=A0ABQ2XHN2_9ACTN|nr:hypothetical protein GCM10010383_55180 [Streptomyces lomondensis]